MESIACIFTISFCHALRNNFLKIFKKGSGKLSTTGIDIVIQLKQLKKQGQPGTQRWLLDRLHESGFPNLQEATLSNILNGRYTVGCAPDVLREAYKIVNAQTQQAS